MSWRKLLSIFLTLSMLAPLALAQSSDLKVEVDLGAQTAYLIRGRQVVLSSPLSTGRAGHLTETGSFKIIEKERNHFSTLYGKIVDASGQVVVKDADADMKVPRGGKFIPAPMRYFMRFHAATGMHAGYLPGYPASHGCVRMPEENAIAFFNAVQVGTPVHVFGRPPRQGEYFQYGPQPTRNSRAQRPEQEEPVYEPREDPRFRDQNDDDPRVDPRFRDPRLRDPRFIDPRLMDPWWR